MSSFNQIEIATVPKEWTSLKLPKVTPIYTPKEQNSFVTKSSNQEIEEKLPPRIIRAKEPYPSEVYLTEVEDMNKTLTKTPIQVGIKFEQNEDDIIDQQLSELKIIPIQQEQQLLTLGSSYRIPTANLMAPASSQVILIASPQSITKRNLSRIETIEKASQEDSIPLVPFPLTAPSLSQSSPVSLPTKVEVVESEPYYFSEFSEDEEYQTPETTLPYVKPVSGKTGQVYDCAICRESKVATEDLLPCGHPICETCISLLPEPYCPFDDTPI